MIRTQPGPEPTSKPILGEATRVRLAANPDTPPALLRQLADDPQLVVRAAVAINRSCAPEIDRMLTEDGDERVRALLAARLASLLPDLSRAEWSSAATHVRRTLNALVEDEALRVRVAIAEAVKSLPGAPRDLILRLANDHAIEVSDPVVRLSPVLTDSDLLALLATPPHPRVAESVAGRDGLSAAVVDAIAAHANAPVIRILLGNRSACIQEATLDALVGRAAEHSEWHEALVRRPVLSTRSARALSEIVARQFLEALAQRSDLDPALAAELRSRIAAAVSRVEPDQGDEAALASVRRLNSANALDETSLLDAARAGDFRRIAAILSVATGVPMPCVDRAAGLRSAKALVSLAWKAGFSMHAGTVVQALLGQLGPGALLTPGPGGTFPLTREEMDWQIELLTQSAR